MEYSWPSPLPWKLDPVLPTRDRERGRITTENRKNPRVWKVRSHFHSIFYVYIHSFYCMSVKCDSRFINYKSWQWLISKTTRLPGTRGTSTGRLAFPPLRSNWSISWIPVDRSPKDLPRPPPSTLDPTWTLSWTREGPFSLLSCGLITVEYK